MNNADISILPIYIIYIQYANIYSANIIIFPEEDWNFPGKNC